MEQLPRMHLYDKVKIIILDLGYKYTKIGFSHDPVPKFIVPTVLNGKRILDVKYSKFLYENLAKFMCQLFFSKLLLNPHETKVIVVESLLVPLSVKQTMAKVLFKHLQVSDALFAPNPLVATYTVAAPCALTIEISHNETTIVPVWEGYPILHAMETFPAAGKAIELEMCKLFENYYENELKEPLPDLADDIIDDIKVRLCFVAPFNKPTDQNSPPAAQYPMAQSKALIVPGTVREKSAEILFIPDDDYNTLPSVILDSILKCPIDTRRYFLSKLLIFGGTSLLPGFKSRLAAELKHLTETNNKYHKLQGDIKIFKPPVHANCVSWLGGSLLSCGEIVNSRCISRDEYLRSGGDIPDWANLKYNNSQKTSAA